MKHMHKSLLSIGLLGLSTSLYAAPVTFNFTGANQTYTVPTGTNNIQIEAWGAQGQATTVDDFGNSTGGLGGFATGNLTVTSGEVLNILVGGTGANGVAGYNGGGLGGSASAGAGGSAGFAGSGGGASDVRAGGNTLADRVIVAGGGGGGGRNYVNGTCVPCGIGGNGGAGGGSTGGDGADPSSSGINGSFPNTGAGGQGGTQVAGGAAGDGSAGPVGNDGALGTGGAGVNGTQGTASGGGGGGFYGGGSGGGATSGNGSASGGGAGGSSYTGGVTSASTTAGINSGNGVVTITPLDTDISITVDDNVTEAVPNVDNITYTIIISNTGGLADPSVTVTDNFPSVLDCDYTSTAMGGATGNTTPGTGDIADTLNLPAMSSITYTVMCTFNNPIASGTLVNTASITTSVTDTDGSNDNAVDDNTVLRPITSIPTLSNIGLVSLMLLLVGYSFRRRLRKS